MDFSLKRIIVGSQLLKNHVKPFLKKIGKLGIGILVEICELSWRVDIMLPFLHCADTNTSLYLSAIK